MLAVLILVVIVLVAAYNLNRWGWYFQPHRYPSEIKEEDAVKNSAPLTSAIMERASPMKKPPA